MAADLGSAEHNRPLSSQKALLSPPRRMAHSVPPGAAVWRQWWGGCRVSPGLGRGEEVWPLLCCVTLGMSLSFLVSVSLCRKRKAWTAGSIWVQMGNQGPERESVCPGSQVREDRVATKPRPLASQTAKGLRGSCYDSSPVALPATPNPGPCRRIRQRMRLQERGGPWKRKVGL